MSLFSTNPTTDLPPLLHKVFDFETMTNACTLLHIEFCLCCELFVGFHQLEKDLDNDIKKRRKPTETTRKNIIVYALATKATDKRDLKPRLKSPHFKSTCGVLLDILACLHNTQVSVVDLPRRCYIVFVRIFALDLLCLRPDKRSDKVKQFAKIAGIASDGEAQLVTQLLQRSHVSNLT
jgi:hypothetical protein